MGTMAYFGRVEGAPVPVNPPHELVVDWPKLRQENGKLK